MRIGYAGLPLMALLAGCPYGIDNKGHLFLDYHEGDTIVYSSLWITDLKLEVREEGDCNLRTSSFSLDDISCDGSFEAFYPGAVDLPDGFYNQWLEEDGVYLNDPIRLGEGRKRADFSPDEVEVLDGLVSYYEEKLGAQRQIERLSR